MAERFPLELLAMLLSEPISRISFARGSNKLENSNDSICYEYDEDAAEIREMGSDRSMASSSSGKRSAIKYSGKTYDSVESIAEFFQKRDAQSGRPRGNSPPVMKGSRAALDAGKDSRAPGTP